MSKKIKKAQVIVATASESRQGFEILLLQTNERRGSFWQNVTGKIEDNETYEEGALREAVEETQLGVDDIVDIIPLALSFEFTDQRQRKVKEECFLIILDKKWEIKIDPSEHQNFKWVPMEEINDESVKFHSNFEALEKAIKILKRWGD